MSFEQDKDFDCEDKCEREKHEHEQCSTHEVKCPKQCFEECKWVRVCEKKCHEPKMKVTVCTKCECQKPRRCECECKCHRPRCCECNK